MPENINGSALLYSAPIPKEVNNLLFIDFTLSAIIPIGFHLLLKLDILSTASKETDKCSTACSHDRAQQRGGASHPRWMGAAGLAYTARSIHP